jgi:hypothetical protein
MRKKKTKLNAFCLLAILQVFKGAEEKYLENFERNKK